MGWKGESRRHSLSRKGIKTNIDKTTRLSVRNFVARGKISIDGVSSTQNYESHKETIRQWTWDERMEHDESCMMADETLQLLDRVLYTTKEDYPEEHQARIEKLKDVRLLEHNGELIGFMKYYDYYPEDNKKVIWMDELFIHPDYRNKGLGISSVKLAFEESGANRMKGNSLDQSLGFWKGIGAWINPIVIRGKRTIAIDYGD